MTPETAFAAFLALTVVLLVGVVVTGLAARRRVHLTLVACTVLSLATTIVFAERVGDHYDLASAGAITPIHLFVAKLTTLAYLAPVFTGWRTLKNPLWRPRHRACAFTVLAMTTATAVTGTWMLFASERLS